MKCIYCSNDSKYSDRTDGKCPSCRKSFAFEPKNGDAITDPAFKAAIDRVSSREQVKFGLEHLRYEVQRIFAAKISNQRRWGWGLFGVGLVAGCALFTPVFPVGIAGLVLAGVGLLIRFLADEPTLTQEKFDALYSKWVSAHGVPKTAIVRRPRQGKEPTEVAPDLLEYSFDRAVICDRNRTVDLLVANQFHFENNCAILGADGYPTHAFKTVRAMLKKNPKLEVFVLHDATLKGCTLAHRLAYDPEWFGGKNLRIVDVGLRPAHAKFFAGMELPGESLPAGVPEGVTRAEMAWLRNHCLELAVVRPDQIVKRLYRAMTQVPATVDSGGSGGDSGGSGDSVYSSDPIIFGSDAGVSDGGGDSFG